MTLRNLVSALLPLPPAGVPAHPKIKKKRLELERRYGSPAVSRITPSDAQVLEARFRHALLTDRWADIPKRDWRRVAWIAFDGASPLADSPVFLRHVLDHFGARRRRSDCGALITAYLRHFDCKKHSFKCIGDEISKVVVAWNWPWRDRHMHLDLFNADSGPSNVATYVLNSAGFPAKCLAGIGLDVGLRTGGFAKAAYMAALRKLEVELGSGRIGRSALERLLEWSVENEKLLYPECRGDLADALLKPWSSRDPSASIKERILRFLLQHLNDPRTDHAQWLTVSDEAKAVMRRWLTREALEQFISVIDHFAVEHMWRYRKAFWMAYFERGVVTDAKVLFGPNAHRYARQAFGSGQSFGLLDRVGIDPNHSVLLLQIGKLTIADWSHNGKCHVWVDGNRNAPALWPNPPKQLYKKDELRKGSDNGVAHMSSETGNWQYKIAEYIKRHTNIEISYRQYMP